MITNCLDISEKDIVRAIDFYKKDHDGNNPNYLIMNYKTRMLLSSHLNFSSNIVNSITMPLGIVERVYTFRGIPIALCDKLDLGEVDVA